MMKLFNLTVWGLLAVGIVSIVFQPFGRHSAILQTYSVIVQVYLVLVSAFFVLKRVAFYKMHGHVDTIKLIKRSEYQVSLLGHGIILGLILLVIGRYQNTPLMSINSIVIALVILYYITQVLINNNPSIYINEFSFAYDDYFIDDWKWKEIKRIEMDKAGVRLISNEKDFELDFALIDQIDYHHLKEEVERSILDGEFTKDRSSKDLASIIKNYASRHGLPLAKSD